MLRITGGDLRGRMLHAPPGTQTRPTQARLRQALFNSIQMQVPDSKVLDLFAGSGALAFEALSRGAQHATLVEQSAPVVQLIRRNATELGVRDNIEVLTDTVEHAIPRLQGAFDIVLADPPYEGGWETRLLEELHWDRLLNPGGILCIEWGRLKSDADTLPEKTAFLVKTREKIYGESVLTTYTKIQKVV